MVKLLISILLWFGSILGIGLFIESKVFSRFTESVRPLKLGDLLLLGLIGVSVLGLGLNFFLPISYPFSFALLGLGWGIVFKSRKVVLPRFQREEGVLTGIVILGVSLVAVSSHYNIDTGYYHFPSVMLTRRFPLIPGIANVFGPYGHNSTWFLIESIFTLPKLGWASTFSLNSLFAVAFFLLLFESFEKSSVFGASFIVLSLLCINLGLIAVGGLTPDLCSLAIGSIICLWELNGDCESEINKRIRGALSVIFTAFAVTIKVSNLLIAIPTVFLLLTGSQKQKCGDKLGDWFKERSFRISLFLAGGLVFLGLMRNVFTSGCLVYPQSGTCFTSLPWAMPRDWVNGWLVDVKYHLCGVRAEGSVFAQSECMKEWIHRLLKEPLLKYILFFVLIAVLMRIFTRSKVPSFSKKNLGRLIQLFVFLVAIPFALWLWGAPNVRFAPWIFLVFGALVIGTFLHPIESMLKGRKIVFYLCLFFGLVSSLRTSIVTNPGAVKWMDWPYIPRVEGIVVQAKKDFEIHTIARGFQCWGVNPPCTPQLNPVEIREINGRAFVTPQIIKER